MPNDNHKVFKILAQKIAQFKEENNLSYQDIGDATNVNKSHVYRIIKMDTYPSFKFLIRLAKYMQVPFYYLFMPTEEYNRQNFIKIVEEKQEEQDITPKELAKKSGIPLLRLMDILNQSSSPTLKEREAIHQVLGIGENTNFFKVKNNLLKSLLSDFGLESSHIENILDYISDNKK